MPRMYDDYGDAFVKETDAQALKKLLWSIPPSALEKSKKRAIETLDEVRNNNQRKKEVEHDGTDSSLYMYSKCTTQGERRILMDSTASGCYAGAVAYFHGKSMSGRQGACQMQQIISPSYLFLNTGGRIKGHNFFCAATALWKMGRGKVVDRLTDEVTHIIVKDDDPTEPAMMLDRAQDCEILRESQLWERYGAYTMEEDVRL